ncbi:hypothetical protein [Lacipirellula limnantheis]|uniref:Uncharacterized protein n=1 Tax=Lacipirellula limnantheis TaxID=2528024 RepID=A0A517U0Z5_9BACT|nr:hypothetical protein [Lacipirellula limnantheis]QDT74299.1 hypothetical protein I41_34940 [Lacipirellula limnantheis]
MTNAQLAEKILSNLQRGFPKKHEFRQVDGSRFPYVNQRFYESASRELADLGFRPLGDIEDVTAKLNGKPDLRTFIRVMTDAENTTVSACFNLAPTFLWRIALLMLRIPRNIVEFESYSGDEFTHSTTITPASATVARPSTMTRVSLPKKTPIREIYERHRLYVKTSFPQPLKTIRTMSDAIELQVAQHAQLRNHLERSGWVTKDYLRRQGVAAAILDDVYDETQKLWKSGFEAA